MRFFRRKNPKKGSPTSMRSPNLSERISSSQNTPKRGRRDRKLKSLARVGSSEDPQSFSITPEDIQQQEKRAPEPEGIQQEKSPYWAKFLSEPEGPMSVVNTDSDLVSLVDWGRSPKNIAPNRKPSSPLSTWSSGENTRIKYRTDSGDKRKVEKAKPGLSSCVAEWGRSPTRSRKRKPASTNITFPSTARSVDRFQATISMNETDAFEDILNMASSNLSSRSEQDTNEHGRLDVGNFSQRNDENNNVPGKNSAHDNRERREPGGRPRPVDLRLDVPSLSDSSSSPAVSSFMRALWEETINSASDIGSPAVSPRQKQTWGTDGGKSKHKSRDPPTGDVRDDDRDSGEEFSRWTLQQVGKGERNIRDNEKLEGPGRLGIAERIDVFDARTGYQQKNRQLEGIDKADKTPRSFRFRNSSSKNNSAQKHTERNQPVSHNTGQVLDESFEVVGAVSNQLNRDKKLRHLQWRGKYAGKNSKVRFSRDLNHPTTSILSYSSSSSSTTEDQPVRSKQSSEKRKEAPSVPQDFSIDTGASDASQDRSASAVSLSSFESLDECIDCPVPIQSQGNCVHDNSGRSLSPKVKGTDTSVRLPKDIPSDNRTSLPNDGKHDENPEAVSGCPEPPSAKCVDCPVPTESRGNHAHSREKSMLPKPQRTGCRVPLLPHDVPVENGTCLLDEEARDDNLAVPPPSTEPPSANFMGYTGGPTLSQASLERNGGQSLLPKSSETGARVPLLAQNNRASTLDQRTRDGSLQIPHGYTESAPAETRILPSVQENIEVELMDEGDSTTSSMRALHEGITSFDPTPKSLRTAQSPVDPETGAFKIGYFPSYQAQTSLPSHQPSSAYPTPYQTRLASVQSPPGFASHYSGQRYQYYEQGTQGGFQPEPIRDYWEPFSSVRPLGSFDSISELDKDEELTLEEQPPEGHGDAQPNPPEPKSDESTVVTKKVKDADVERERTRRKVARLVADRSIDETEVETVLSDDDSTRTSTKRSQGCSLICGDFDFSIKAWPYC